ncbi:MAG: ferritin-like domain-containing protein [Gaiellaceae bacterium]
MAGRVSNPRDLLVLLLGEVLHVERRLAGEVLRSLVDAVRDEELTASLRTHLDETKEHVERVETVFRRLELAPSAHLSRPFESAVAQHDELASQIVEPTLADVFHAQAAMQTEHWEIAAYTTVLDIGSRFDADLGLLEDSLAEELRAREQLRAVIARLARG